MATTVVPPTRSTASISGVSFSVDAGKTLALVGESGCGKSTVSRLVLRLIEPDAGRIRFEGRDLLALDANELRAFRRDAQIIFQDPYASLNPRMTVGQILTEPLALHDLVPPSARRERVEELSSRNSSSATSRYRRWMCRSVRKS